MVDTISDINSPLGITIANINFPCPTPLDRMCIETTRIFDSSKFEAELKEIFKLPCLNNVQCDIVKTQCSILNITKIDEQKDLVNVNLQIKVFISFTSKCSNCTLFEKVVCFHKNITLIKPEDAHLSCTVNNVTCSCIEPDNVAKACCNRNLCCTIKVTAIVDSKKLVQIEVPVLRYSELN
ncbi:hypothetical protein SDC9_128443 [bioreactor metagenome]|uniref:SipL SPOCS domain-containing protein n=1 Tax=bioreactor metagenome TaxID=1076179 RepID=A0A645CW58_9ZZZZ